LGFSFTSSSREVLEQVVQDPRFRSLTTIPLFAPMEIGLVVGAFLLFGLSSYFYLAGDLGWFWMTGLNSLAVYASFTPLHDATHRTVSRNRRFNDFVGTLSCLLLLPGITTRIYRYLHLQHHRYAGEVGRDPDEPFVSSRGVRVVLTLAGLDVLWTRWYLSQWNTRPSGERIEFAASIAFYVLFHIAWLVSPYALEFLLVWVIPQRLGLFYVSWFFARIQHPEDVLWEKTPFQTTVRIISNPLAKVMLLGQADHHVHHLAPSLPWYRYAQAWELGKHLLVGQNIPTRTLFAPSKDLQLPQVQETVWLAAKIDKIVEVGNGVRCVDLCPAEPGTLPRWPEFTAGAHIDAMLGGKTDSLIRQYTLCNSPREKDRYVIAVQREAQGRGGSRFFHDQLSVGDILQISAPRNSFPLSSEYADYLMIAGGIGITPLLAMAHELTVAGSSFALHVCANQARGIPFQRDLSELPFAKDIVTHVGIRQSDATFDSAAVVGPYQSGRALYLCGPPGFMRSIMQQARQLGWPTDAIFSESFVASTRADDPNTAFEVELVRSGRVLQVAADESLLDVLNANDCAVICSCTQGICGSCMTPVLDGVPAHRDVIMTEAERAKNNQMTVCVSRSVSDRLVLDL